MIPDKPNKTSASKENSSRVDPDNYPISATEQWVSFLPEEIQPVAIAAMELRQVKRQTTIYALHSANTEMYTVLDGTVKLTTTTASGKDVAITTMPRGCTFGEISFIDQQPRHNIAIASTDCTLAVLNRRQYNQLCQEYPQITEAMLNFFAHRLRTLISIHQDTTSLELPQQLARRLLFIAGNQNDGKALPQPYDISVSQDELAATLGVSRQHVNKAIKKWQGEGLIEVGYRKITLLDAQGLKSVASDD